MGEDRARRQGRVDRDPGPHRRRRRLAGQPVRVPRQLGRAGLRRPRDRWPDLTGCGRLGSRHLRPGESGRSRVHPFSSGHPSRRGMQVIELDTKWFTGEVLVMNNEPCGPGAKNAKGGVTLWDVTNPLKPKKLSEHFGDRGFADFHEIHSAFAWQAGDRAFVVMTDNVEFPDVDIMEITNPHRLRLIAELDLNDFDVDQPELGLTDSFLHDMVVKQIDGRWVMLLSYWDGGWVLLDVDDPANPEFIADSDYPAVDPELLEELG